MPQVPGEAAAQMSAQGVRQPRKGGSDAPASRNVHFAEDVDKAPKPSYDKNTVASTPQMPGEAASQMSVQGFEEPKKLKLKSEDGLPSAPPGPEGGVATKGASVKTGAPGLQHPRQQANVAMKPALQVAEGKRKADAGKSPPDEAQSKNDETSGGSEAALHLGEIANQLGMVAAQMGSEDPSIPKMDGREAPAKRRVHFSESANEVFQPFAEDFTPRIPKRTAYKKVQQRLDVSSACGPSTVARPNYEDMLRRISIVVHRHIVKCEEWWSAVKEQKGDVGMFRKSKLETYDERNFVTPRHRITFLHVPGFSIGSQFALRKVEHRYKSPTVSEVHEFTSTLFRRAYLSAECAVVSLIYLERLMENAAPVMSATWRPIVLCSLLLASKVWQDLSSWNIEFNQTYPEFSLQAINRLELIFLQDINWDLYISQSLYAKYHFALRAAASESNFRNKYMNMLRQQPANASVVERRSTAAKEDVLKLLSKSL